MGIMRVGAMRAYFYVDAKGHTYVRLPVGDQEYHKYDMCGRLVEAMYIIPHM